MQASLMQASDIKRLRDLEDEDRRLKQMSADLLLAVREQTALWLNEYTKNDQILWAN